MQPNQIEIPDNPYLLLTPGPLCTSPGVRAAMLRDWCTWDAEYNDIVQVIRNRLTRLATPSSGFTTVLMQGSGTFSVEACLGTVIPRHGKLLVLSNGHYGDRIAMIAKRLPIPYEVLDFGETGPLDLDAVNSTLQADRTISHVAMVHCETSTGMLNSIQDVGNVVIRHSRSLIVDAMSSFGAIPLNMSHYWVDYLVAGPNKCLQGIPGFGFVVARQTELEECAGNARSFSLDLFDQWMEMEHHGGKWRFTSPTHAVRAFAQALKELDAEGGVAGRQERYVQLQTILVRGMRGLGFETLLPDEHQSPIITAFLYPAHPGFEFARFHAELKQRGFVISPGKVTRQDTFRIGNIGHVWPDDILALLQAVRESMYWT